MKRNAIDALSQWKNSEDRKPMVLKGTRQIEKKLADERIRAELLSTLCLFQL